MISLLRYSLEKNLQPICQLLGGLLDLSNLGDSELQSLLNNMNQQQLMNLFGGSLGGSGGGTGGMGELAALLGQSGRQRSHARAAAAAAEPRGTAARAKGCSVRRPPRPDEFYG